jgi:hypothetical protein
MIRQFGYGAKKEDSAQAWQGLASLGFTTFSIDLRDYGARAASPYAL